MPPSTQPDLRLFLRDTVNLAPARLRTVRATVDHLRTELIRHREANDGFTLMAILNSGSVEKKTLISPLGDIDVAVLLRPEQASGEGMPNLLEHVRELLIQVYAPKERGDYTIGRHAVRIYFRGIDLSVDVVPIIPEAGREGFALLPTRDSNEWVSTSIPRHMHFIRKRSGMHPVFLELVRLVKWWRNERGVHFKSFLIELLSAHLLDTKAVPGDDLHEALLGFFGYIVRSGLREPISFKDYYDTAEVVGTDDAVQVFDPVNPSNNVARAIDELRRRELVDACRGAFDALASAQTAPTPALVRAHFQRVFGPQFTLPEDIPGEPSTPTGTDHVRAKIHADLRQLRLLNGGFSKAAEDSKARALALWVDRGLAAVIELVYYEPESRDRRLALRYRIDRESGSADDHDCGGVPVARVDGTRFDLRITPTDDWSRKSDQERAAFYQELGDGWGPADPLTESQGAWLPVVVVYARGKLAASRTIFHAHQDPYSKR
jgi:hypothetical protein